MIEELKPDVLVLGPDPWDRVEIERELKKRGLMTVVAQIGGFTLRVGSTGHHKL